MRNPTLATTVLASLALALAGAPRAGASGKGHGRPKAQAAARPAGPPPTATPSPESWLPQGVLAGPMGPGRSGPRPRKVNGYLIQAGANLRGADLRDADLRGADLTGADLRGADCTGARFGGADLTGALLERTRLFDAKLAGALGADLSVAETHPFFTPQPGEEVGTVHYFSTELLKGDQEQPPCNLVCAPDRRLIWLNSSPGLLRSASPTGEQYVYFGQGANPQLAIAKDNQDRLWLFGAQSFGLIPLAGFGALNAQAWTTIPTAPAHFSERPTSVAADGDGAMRVCLGHKIFQFRLEGRQFLWDFVELGSTRGGPPNWRTWPDRSGTRILITAPDEPGIQILPADPDKAAEPAHSSLVPLPADCGVNRVIPGRGDRMWFAQCGARPAIGWIDLDTRTHGAFSPPGQGGGLQAPFDLALGPDGNLWFTEPDSGRIGRLTLEGGCTWFGPLPGGLRPQEIVASPDGRMLFTVAGHNLIGSIRAVAVPRAEDKSWEVELPEPAAEPRKAPTFTERHLAMDRRAERSESAGAAPAQEPGPEARDKPAGPPDAPAPGPEPRSETKVKPAAPEPRLGPKVKAAAPPAAGPSSPLPALGVDLPAESVQHIRHRHMSAQGAQWRAGQFASAWSSPSALAKLIGQGLTEAGEVGRIRVTDRQGNARFLTFCQAANVGRHWTGRGWEDTRWFVVVTARDGLAGKAGHRVVSAYPVPPPGRAAD